MKIAIFDLGTNVFNLLIAQVSKSKCYISKVVKVGSGIGEGGFAKRFLTDAVMELAIEAISSLVKEIELEGGVEHMKAFATSAIREASNREQFVERVKEKFGFTIEIISGDREAELIYKGIRESLLIYNERVLMVDVGGGSNELIIADREGILYKQSAPLGVIRVKERIEPSDPITQDEIERYTQLIDTTLEPFYSVIESYKPTLMIGSSGSFDTLRELLDPKDNFKIQAKELPLEELSQLHQKLLLTTREERFKMAGMSGLRAEYMVLGSIFINHIIERSGIKELYQSSFSLKEGYMAEFASTL